MQGPLCVSISEDHHWQSPRDDHPRELGCLDRIDLLVARDLNERSFVCVALEDHRWLEAPLIRQIAPPRVGGGDRIHPEIARKSG